MFSKTGSRSTSELKFPTKSKGKNFQQDYQNEENPEVLNQFLLDSQIKETQNKQKLYQSRRENEGLKETLNELEAQKKKLEFAKDINQKFFKKNENEMASLRKPLEGPNFALGNLSSSETHEALREKIKEMQSKNRQELDGLIEKYPDFDRILNTSDQDLKQILDLIKVQISIFKEDLTQKERAYRHMQDRYQGEFDVLSEQHRNILVKIHELALDQKNDMQKKYLLERKIAYLEADVEVGNGYVNAQKLAMIAAKEVNSKIQKSDVTNSLNALSTRIQRRITATKPI